MESLGKLSFGSTGWGDELLIGAVMTVGLALASVLIGLIIGGKLAFFKLQPNRFFEPSLMRSRFYSEALPSFS
jgi:ABC-type arginine transport system permease subunit